MPSFEENRLRANKWFSLYYEAAMEWIGDNIEDVKKFVKNMTQLCQKKN